MMKKITLYRLILIFILATPIMSISLTYANLSQFQSIDYEYKKEAVKVTVYKDESVLVRSGWCESKNATCHDAKYNTIKVVDYVDTIYVDTKTRKSADIDGKIYEGNINVENDVIYRWNVPTGDRNYEEFGHCLPHEIKKGVCEIVR